MLLIIINWLFIDPSGHPPDQPDHRTHDLWYRPRARWSSAADGSASDSGGPWEHAGYCKCEFAFLLVNTSVYTHNDVTVNLSTWCLDPPCPEALLNVGFLLSEVALLAQFSLVNLDQVKTPLWSLNFVIKDSREKRHGHWVYHSKDKS